MSRVGAPRWLCSKFSQSCNSRRESLSSPSRKKSPSIRHCSTDWMELAHSRKYAGMSSESRTETPTSLPPGCLYSPRPSILEFLAVPIAVPVGPVAGAQDEDGFDQSPDSGNDRSDEDDPSDPGSATAGPRPCLCIPDRSCARRGCRGTAEQAGDDLDFARSHSRAAVGVA